MQIKQITANLGKVFRILTEDGDGERSGTVIGRAGLGWNVRFLDGSESSIRTADILGLSENRQDDGGPVQKSAETPPLTEAFIEANLGKLFICRADDEEEEWEGTITGRRHDRPGYWEASDRYGSLRIVAHAAIRRLKDSPASVVAGQPAGTDRPDAVTEAEADQQDLNPQPAATTDPVITGATELPADPQPAADHNEAPVPQTPTGQGNDTVLPAEETSQNGNNREPDESWELPQLAAFINRRLRRTDEDNWWIGKAVDLAHKKHTEERDWLRWLAATGLSKSSAYRYRDLYKGYTLEEIRARGGVGLVKLLEELRPAEHDGTDEAQGRGHSEPYTIFHPPAEEDEDSEDGEEEVAEDGDRRGADDEDQAEEDVAEDGDGAEEDQEDDESDDGEEKPEQEKHKVAKKSEKRKEDAHREEEHQPVTEDERLAFVAFVHAVGGVSRAAYVCQAEIEHYKEVGDQEGTDVT
jgi:hypothetical protein